MQIISYFLPWHIIVRNTYILRFCKLQNHRKYNWLCQSYRRFVSVQLHSRALFCCESNILVHMNEPGRWSCNRLIKKRKLLFYIQKRSIDFIKMKNNCLYDCLSIYIFQIPDKYSAKLLYQVLRTSLKFTFSTEIKLQRIILAVKYIKWLCIFDQKKNHKIRV